MKNIMQKENQTFDSFKEYYQDIRNVVTKDANGHFVDPFGNVIRSFKMDELGRLIGVYIRQDYGDIGMVLFGEPAGKFEVQGNDNSDLFSFVFDKGLLVEEHKSDRAGYVHRKYGPQSEGRPIYELYVHHGGPFQKKRWSPDGKTLIQKEVHLMDDACLEKKTKESLDHNGQWRRRIDWNLKGRWVQSEQYRPDKEGQERLQWLCEVDHKQRLVFYRPDQNSDKLHVTNIIADVNGKKRRLDLTPIKIARGINR